VVDQGRVGKRDAAITAETAYNSRKCTAREVPMPVYDYVCLDCHKFFETILSLNEHDTENPKCPQCGSENVEQEAAAFFAMTSRKS
jgi:putative FmdB family regulatory protein